VHKVMDSKSGQVSHCMDLEHGVQWVRLEPTHPYLGSSARYDPGVLGAVSKRQGLSIGLVNYSAKHYVSRRELRAVTSSERLDPQSLHPPTLPPGRRCPRWGPHAGSTGAPVSRQHCGPWLQPSAHGSARSCAAAMNAPSRYLLGTTPMFAVCAQCIWGTFEPQPSSDESASITMPKGAVLEVVPASTDQTSRHDWMSVGSCKRSPSCRAHCPHGMRGCSPPGGYDRSVESVRQESVKVWVWATYCTCSLLTWYQRNPLTVWFTNGAIMPPL
jgi:hypothetical protein